MTGDVDAWESELGKLGSLRTMIPSRIITPAPRKPVEESVPGRSPTLRESMPVNGGNSSFGVIGVGELIVVVGVGGIAVKSGCWTLRRGKFWGVDNGGGIGLCALSTCLFSLPS